MSNSNHTGNGNGNKDFSLPSHPEIERYVLGAILISDSETATIWDTLDTSDFAVRDHQTIYRRMRALHKRGTALDYATVGAELQTHGELQMIGGLGALVDLDRGAPELRHVGSYIEIVAADARRRRMIHAGNALMLSAADPLLDPALVLREHRERLEEMETTEPATLEGGDVWSYEAKETYLVEALIAENAITAMFSAESGAGKSLLLLAMAAAVARGTAFAGRETKPRRVLSTSTVRCPCLSSKSACVRWASSRSIRGSASWAAGRKANHRDQPRQNCWHWRVRSRHSLF